MSVRKTERLMNLLIMLLVSRQYVSKQRLREALEEYREAKSDEAFEKMFERDKEDLRALGVPIEMGSWDPLFDDDQGYRIKRSEFELPEIALEADEAAVVGLAARVWQHAGLASTTASALRKLSADGVVVDSGALGIIEPHLAAAEPSFEVFLQAAADRRPVRFDYRATASAEVHTRLLEPWGVVSFRGRWYVVGHDRDRDDTRMFRLSRVIGDVEYAGGPDAFEVPAGTDVRELARRLAPPAPDRDAELLVTPGRAVPLRRRATSTVVEAPEGWDRITVPFGRLDTLVDEICELGDRVVAVAPDDLRAAVVARLTAAAQRAGGTP